jgi:D-3-phosphoglycerate dehydrogenase
MNVVAFNRTQKAEELVFDHLPFKPTPKLTINTTSLEEVCRQSDFISLHLPHKSGQPPVLSSKEFDMMKKGVVIINTARGGVIDEKELADALKSGKVAFAALDVFENEPNVSEDILKVQNVSYTPHIGASTQEGQQRVSQEVAEVIIDKLKK